ncbi:MAG: hypothetical protein LKM36_13840 [Flavobacteriales bacterium]|nr:hypothetical protein [Flavobacteriales bacterium]
MGLKFSWSTQAALSTVRKSSAICSELMRPRTSRTLVMSGSAWNWLYLRWKMGCTGVIAERLKKSWLK